MKTALLITTYNWPKALELVLYSVLHQHVMPDEVVIADDGSTEETKKLIDRYAEKMPVPKFGSENGTYEKSEKTFSGGNRKTGKLQSPRVDG